MSRIRINWKNPLTRNLIFFGPCDERGTDAVSGLTPTVAGSAKIIRYQFPGPSYFNGFAVDNRAGEAGGDYGAHWNLSSQILAVDGGQELSTMAFIHRTGTPQDWEFYFGIQDEGTENYQVALVKNWTSNNLFIALQGPTDTRNNISSVNGALNLGDGELHVVTARSHASGCDFVHYINGAEFDSGTDSSPTGLTMEIDGLTSPTVAMAALRSDGTDGMTGVVGMGAIWNRELQPHEIKALYDNPWQIFEPQSFYVPVFPYDPNAIVLEEQGPQTVEGTVSFDISTDTSEINLLSAAINQAFTINLSQVEAGELGAITLTITLVDSAGTPLQNLSGLSWAWFDESAINNLTVPPDVGTSATTDSSGLFSVTLSNTTLTSGQTGILAIQDSTGFIYAIYRVELT